MTESTPPQFEVAIRPIRTEEDYHAALEAVTAFMDAEPGTPEGDRLDILVTLISAYELRRHPILPPDPVEAILHAMDRQGLTRRDMERYIGTRARVSEVLSRKRPLTLAMVRKLQSGLGIPADILVQPYPIKQNERIRLASAGG